MRARAGREPRHNGPVGAPDFLAKYQAKCDKAATCLAKDREALLVFYDFPAEHWKHIRSTDEVESTFATVRLRTDKTTGCLSRATALALVFKLAKSAERHWRRLNGSDRLAETYIAIAGGFVDLAALLDAWSRRAWSAKRSVGRLTLGARWPR